MALKVKAYSTVQFANIVGVCPTTVRRWDNDKILIAHRLANGRRYYNDEDVTEALKRLNVDAKTQIQPLETRYSTGTFAKMIGVCISTLQSWDRGTADKPAVLKAYRTLTNMRYYTEDHLKLVNGNK